MIDMCKIKVFYGNEPCLEEFEGFGLHRNREPDAGWSQLRRTVIAEAKEVELTENLRKILIEDVAYWIGSNTNKFSAVMDKFGLYKIPYK